MFYWLHTPTSYQQLLFRIHRCVRITPPPSKLMTTTEWLIGIDMSTLKACLLLRSAARGDLAVPRSRITRHGQTCFAVSGPRLWNSLPLSVRDPSLTLTQFCARLKTVILQSIRNTKKFTYLLTYWLHTCLLSFRTVIRSGIRWINRDAFQYNRHLQKL